jgi:hypothetical protein
VRQAVTALAEIGQMPDETAAMESAQAYEATSAGFWERAAAFFADHGITTEQRLTDKRHPATAAATTPPP